MLWSVPRRCTSPEQMEMESQGGNWRTEVDLEGCCVYHKSLIDLIVLIEAGP